MKLTIFYKNSVSKKDTSKEMDDVISSLESVLSKIIKKNPHFDGVKSVQLTMTLCGKAKIRSLNKQYRDKDKVTDVLSFPLYDNLRPDQKVGQKNFEMMDLGDLIICREKALSQSKEFNITYEQEVIHLAVHGFLHLLGFDHEISEKEEKIMEAHENEIVGEIYKKLKNLTSKK